MTSINPVDLPEILFAIAAYLERNDVVNCLRVSATWFKLLTPLLWKDITITSGEDFLTRKGPTPDALQAHRDLVHALHIDQGLPCRYSAAYPKLHSLRIKSLLPIRHRGAFGEDLTEFISLNPSLVSLALTGLDGYLCAALWRAVSELPNLKTLELAQAGMPTVDDANAFWMACTNLDHLKLFNAHFAERGISVLDIPIPDMLFPLMTKLELGFPLRNPRNQFDLMRRCPHLKELSWQSERRDPALQVFAEDVLQGAWPGLEKLSLSHHISDEILETILNGMQRITALDLVLNEFGTLSFKTLRRHFNSISRLNLNRCPFVTSDMLREIMCSCPHLLDLQGGDMLAKDVITDEPWVCLSIRNLSVCFIFDNTELNLRPLIFGRLSKLVHLESLGVGGWSSLRIKSLPFTLDLRLESGLGELAKLRKLTEIDVSNTDQHLEEEDIQWMLENWRQLKRIGGMARKNSAFDNIVEILYTRGIDTAFRLLPSDALSAQPHSQSDIVSIKPRFDSKTGEYIILWNDILMTFKNASHIRIDGVAVPFLTDDNFEFLKPLRINAYPGNVLDVVLEEPPKNDLSVESLRISDTPNQSPGSTSPNSTPPPVTPTSGNQEQRTTRAPQYRGGSLDNKATSPTVARSPQFIPEDYVSKDNLYAYTQPSTEDNDGRGGVSQIEIVAAYKEGLSYYYGDGVTKDYFKASTFLVKAANLGHASAQRLLGLMYRYGKGVPQSYPKAFEWYHKAAQQGHAEAQREVGSLYRDGFGVTQDYFKAVEWYLKASENGDVAAQINLGSLYAVGRGIPKDMTKAMECFLKAAEKGHAYAQHNIGVSYYNGNGVKQDYSKAVEWFTKSADQGNADAQCNLGLAYHSGKGVPVDYSKAIEWYTKSADKGNPRAQRSLGEMYQKGQGVPQDIVKAFELIRKSAMQGNAFAQNLMGNMYYNGEGVQRDRVVARDWWSKAAKQGNATAQTNLQKFT
ncbi:hypothetical protein BGX26_007218 [Mortierella sp. AD094]|nr:hypothetical protein BGX26_007218 [Mortierella sp. AD094]